MEEIRPVNKDIEKTLKTLEACKDRVWKQMESIILERMEQPLQMELDDKTDAGFMSLIAIECLIELARSGVDLLSQVNDKDGAIFTITTF